ncbi:MAG: hypothetical protein ACOY3K_06330 [Candidatus Omnitrophota bacterium]
MKETTLLRKVFELVKASGVFQKKWDSELMDDLFRMHDRRWLYCSFRGSDLLAVAGAFRIPEWDDRYFNELPEVDEGEILYVPFLVSTADEPLVPLRLVKFCLRENASIKEIIYYKKYPEERGRRVALRSRFSVQEVKPDLDLLAESVALS